MFPDTLEACAFSARLGNRSVLILDPRLIKVDLCVGGFSKRSFSKDPVEIEENSDWFHIQLVILLSLQDIIWKGYN